MISNKIMIIFSLILIIMAICFIGSVSAAESDKTTQTQTYEGVSSTSTGLATTAWPNFRHDTQNTGQSVYSGPTKSNIIWRFYIPYSGSSPPTSSDMLTTPAIDNSGNIYYGTSAHGLLCVSKNGKLKWRYPIKSGYNSYSIHSAPALDKSGNIYFGCDNGYLYALNSSGKLKWKYKVGSNYKILSSSPNIDKLGNIYIGSDRGLFSISLNGKLNWRYITSDNIESTPAIDKYGNVYFTGYNLSTEDEIVGDWDSGNYSYITYTIDSQNLYAIDQLGNLKWVYKTTIKFVMLSYLHPSSSDSSPLIDKNGIIYFGSHDKNVYAIKPDGTLLWKYKTGGMIYSSPAIDKNGKIYIGSDDGKLYSINSTGKLNWLYKTTCIIRSSPAIDKNGNIYFSNTDGCEIRFSDFPFSVPLGLGRYVALNPKGKAIWAVNISTNYSSPIIGGPGRVYAYVVNSKTHIDEMVCIQ